MQVKYQQIILISLPILLLTFYTQMILEKINKQPSKPNEVRTKIKGSYSFSLNKVNPHRTNFIFKKIKQPEEIQLNCIPSYNSAYDVNVSKSNNDRKKDRLIIQQSTELSCTNFMKHYIDKLKKERKRHNKILKNKINAQKQEEQLRYNSANNANKIYLGKQHVYLSKQLNNIFVLQRLSQTSRKIHTSNFMNTISMAAEQLNTLDGRYTKRYQKQINKERKKQNQSEPGWANKDKIDKLIKHIRQSRQKLISETELNQISQISKQLQKKINERHNNLHPSFVSAEIKSLENTTRLRSFSLNKKNTKIENNGFKALQPWKQQVQLQKAQFGGIQQYNKNFIEQL